MMDLHAEPEPSAPTPQPQPPPSTAAVAESERAKPPAEAAPGLDADAAPATPQQRKQGGPPARDGSETGPGNADDNPFEVRYMMSGCGACGSALQSVLMPWTANNRSSEFELLKEKTLFKESF